MKIFFVVSDVHSYFDEMMIALSKADFDINNNNHIFVSCGDLLDRGPDAVKCLEFVNNLEDSRKILIQGNHEDLLQEAIYRGSFRSHDYHNHTNETVYQLTGITPQKGNFIDVDRTALLDMKTNNLWEEYRTKCINFYETEKYIFVHGWIPVKKQFSSYIDKSYNKSRFQSDLVYNDNWRDSISDWEESRWLNGMAMWSMGIREPDKTIICGHWNSSYGHARLHNEGVEFSETTEGIQSIHTPFYDDGIIALDACTAYSGFVNCIKLEVEDE